MQGPFRHGGNHVENRRLLAVGNNPRPKRMPRDLDRQIAQWEMRDLRLALAIMNMVITDEVRAKFWELYRQHAVLNPAPSCVLIQDTQQPTPPPES